MENQMQTDTTEIKATEETTTVESTPVVAKQEIVQASETETKQELVEATTLVVEEPVVTKAPQVVKQGTVVMSTSAPLGKAVSKESEKRILSQSSTIVSPVLSAFEAKVKSFEEKGTNHQKTIISALKRYMKEMPCGVEIDTEIARLQQRSLWNTILSIINTDDNFRENWRMLISFFRHYSQSSFGDKYVNRYMDHLSNFKQNELVTFTQVLALLSVTVSTANVKDVPKQIVLQRALTPPIKADAQQRVVNFYS